METLPVALPTIQDLYSQNDITALDKQNQLNVLLNQNPNPKWLKNHPTATKKVNGVSVPIQYIPIDRIEWLLTSIFVKWSVEILREQLIANSIAVTVRLHYKNPITGEMECQDGCGAAPLQTDKGSGAVDFNNIKSNAVQIALPAAKSYAVKDAAEVLGKLFGKDINRADELSYNSFTDKFTTVTIEELKDLVLEKEQLLTKDELTNAMRIINCEEKNSYKKLFNFLKSKTNE
jgi:hypothetical protein